MKEKAKTPGDSNHLKTHIMCWNELLEEFLKFGFLISDVDFDMTEAKNGQFIIHLKPKFFKGLKECYAEESCHFPKEVLKLIKFGGGNIFIEEDHSYCLSNLQYIISLYRSKVSDEFEEKIKARKAEMEAGLKIAIRKAKLSPAITVKIPPAYYKMKQNEYFINLKLTVGKRRLRRVLISSKDTLDEIVAKIKGIK